jgi:hypothetical protein
MNYSIKHKTPLKWGLYWMRLGILGLSGENVNINFPFVIINNKVILKVSI